MEVYESLYPNTLFHFTRSKEVLFSILNDTFRVSYARESIAGPSSRRELGVPMVSFCDLKLLELKSHIKKYGCYGIGLTKEWANRMGLNPVMYISRHCELTDDFMNGLNGIYNHLDKLNDIEQINKLNKSYINILNTYRYLKNYEGELVRNGQVVDENYRFADEREWRYVPSLNLTGVQPFIAKSNIDTSEKKELLNDRISHLRLSFQPDDIKYLIIEKDEEISEVIEHLKHAKKGYDRTIRDRLASRILTVDQIRKDI